jgi:undecaprenyl-diphosphatase
LVVGIAQAVSIIPGISRSGATIGAGLLVGMRREFAPQFAFVLGVPAILGAAIFKTPEIIHQATTAGGAAGIAAGGVAAAISGYLAIVVVMGVVRRGKLTVFGWYCLAAAASALLWGAVRG